MTFLDEKKASDIHSINLKEKSSLADSLIIATGTSQKHIQALAAYVQKYIKDKKISPCRVEGDSHSDWVIIDIGDILIHLFTNQSRQLYDLEKIWDSPLQEPKA